MKQVVAQVKYRKIRTAHRERIAALYMQRVARVNLARIVAANREQWNREDAVSYLIQRAALHTLHSIGLPQIKLELEKEKVRSRTFHGLTPVGPHLSREAG